MMTGRFFLSFFSAFLWISPTVQADSRVKVGSPAPPLTLKDVLQASEQTHGTWEELRGKAVVIEFWATWCGGCVDNIVNELAEKFASRPLQFISIKDEMDVELVKRSLERHPIRFGKLAKSFGIWWTRGESNPRPPRCERGKF